MSTIQQPIEQLRSARGLDQSVVSTGSIQQPYDRHHAVRLIRHGRPVGTFVRGVCVIWVDAGNRDAVETIQRIKGEKRRGQPMATTLELETIVKLMDAENIPPGLKGVLLNPRELEARLGTLCLLRFPVRREAAAHLPSAIVSRTDDWLYWVQSWIPGGEGAPNHLTQELRAQGVHFPGVTSMNISGEPEIVEEAEAQAFCAAHAIPLFLRDPIARKIVQGSFPILQVDGKGVRLVREGHFRGELFQTLLDGAVIDRSQARPAKYPLVQTDALASITSPYQLHDQIVRLLDSTGGGSDGCDSCFALGKDAYQ